MLRVLVDEVVKDGALRRELDRLELVDEPLAELDPMVDRLVEEQSTAKGPDTRENEVDFMPLLGTIRRRV